MLPLRSQSYGAPKIRKDYSDPLIRVEEFDLNIQRDGDVIHIAALRDDGTVGALMSFPASRALEVVNALMAVCD